MQICECLVYIGGDIGNSVVKQNTSAAEVAVLRAIHGNDSVRNIKVKEVRDVSPDEERERLSLVYNPELVGQLFGKFGDLPETLEAARVDADLILADETKKVRSSKKMAAEPVEAAAPIGE